MINFIAIFKWFLSHLSTLFTYFLIGSLIFMLFYSGVIYAKFGKYYITIGLKDPHAIESVEESIRASEDALNDPELKRIIEDARNRGILE